MIVTKGKKIIYIKEESENMKIGKMLILPSNFTDSQRFLKQNYLYSMSIVNRYRKPYLFITMTCNPNWKEISEN